MERSDLERALERRPDLGDIWAQRIARLEAERNHAWTTLRATARAADPPIDTVVHDIERLDRSISFLDRLLLHLEDVHAGTHYADGLPYAPA